MAADRTEELERALYSIAVGLGLEVWNDVPAGDLMHSIERAVMARELKAFLRGQRSANVGAGRDPDELPPEIPTLEPEDAL